MDKIYSREEVGEALKFVRLEAGVGRRELAKMLGCSISTITRLENGDTQATDEMYNRLKALMIIGQNYSYDNTAEIAAGAAGAAGGVAGATAAVSAAGSVAGLSATGMTSGLAALGLGSMATGIGVIAAIPIAAGLASYGVIKGITSLAKANKLDCKKLDDVLEIHMKTVDANKELSS
ncbi:MAG: helix-turn-helix transcriptional regulator [Aestuariivita sp.]|nr:helix-turn-helix transcriptional regulator [Aestuariivita sp.]MCY4202080.1 helix-turn-helix transcriptional regulator [Aestuariivita sp.]